MVSRGITEKHSIFHVRNSLFSSRWLSWATSWRLLPLQGKVSLEQISSMHPIQPIVGIALIFFTFTFEVCSRSHSSPNVFKIQRTDIHPINTTKYLVFEFTLFVHKTSRSCWVFFFIFLSLSTTWISVFIELSEMPSFHIACVLGLGLTTQRWWC